MSHRTRIMLSFCLALCLALSFGSQAYAKKFVSMGTNPVGMAWYTMGAALAEVMRTEAPDIELTIEATNGAVHNLNLMAVGDIEFGLTAASEAIDAYEGDGRYSVKVPILGMFAATIAFQQAVTTANSGITSIDNLRDKRVGIGPPGSSSRVDTMLMLAAYDINLDDIKGFSETLPEMVEKTKNGQLDAIMWFGVSPLAPLMDLDQSRDVVWIPANEEKVLAMQKDYPYYFFTHLPANTYPKQTEAIPALAHRYNMVARADMDEDLVYQITKTTIENLDKLSGIYKGWETCSREHLLQSMAIPLHPGAIRYFREINLPGLDEYIAKYPNS